MAGTVLLLALSSLSLTLFLLAPFPGAVASDPDPLQDFCVADPAAAGVVHVNGLPCKPSANVTADDFFSRVLVNRGDVTANPFGANLTAANVASFPGLNSLGISMNRVDFGPGGLNPPHSHPRATELILLVEGQLLVGFVSTANVFYSKVLVTPGELFVVPRGLVHFQYNVGGGRAQAITTFNSQLPGAVLAAPTLFGSKPAIPDEVLEKAFQVDQGLIDQIKAKFGN